MNRQTTRQTDHGQTELNNMLVKRSVLNEKKKVGTYSGFQGLKEDQRDSILKLDNLQNFLIKLTVKSSAEKEWLSTL